MKFAKLAVVVAGTFAASAAFAADLPAAKGPAPAPVFTSPVYNWTAFYIGAHVGYSWTRGSSTSYNTVTGAVTGTGSSTDTAFHGGAQVGYDYMFASRFVVGLVADLSSGSSSTAIDSNAAGTVVSSVKGKTDLTGTIRGRVGYGFDKVLAYATGGWAWSSGNVTRTQVLGTVGLATPGTSESISRSRNGWTLGAGLEYAITPNWSAFGEYRYTSYGNSTITYPIAQRRSTGSTTSNSVRAGINYRFSTGPAAVVARY